MHPGNGGTETLRKAYISPANADRCQMLLCHVPAPGNIADSVGFAAKAAQVLTRFAFAGEI